MPKHDMKAICDTAKAGEFLGNKLIYLEAGSGALDPVPAYIIQKVKEKLSVPLLVGGGIKDPATIEKMHNAGADIVVIGTAIEQDLSFFDNLI